jgi:chromate reductase
VNVYTIVSASTRTDSQSSRITEYVAAQLARIDREGLIHEVDLATRKLPMWCEEFWNDAGLSPEWNEVSALLHKTDGLIFVVPEWNGMVPPPLMNVFLLASRGEMSHKPALIVSVSRGSGGSLPVSMLRAFGYKNNQICYVPDHVIVRNAAAMLRDGEDSDGEMDKSLRARMMYSLSVFKVYVENFKNIRKCAPIDLESFPYGM